MSADVTPFESQEITSMSVRDEHPFSKPSVRIKLSNLNYELLVIVYTSSILQTCLPVLSLDSCSTLGP